MRETIIIVSIYYYDVNFFDETWYIECLQLLEYYSFRHLIFKKLKQLPPL